MVMVLNRDWCLTSVGVAMGKIQQFEHGATLYLWDWTIL